MAIDDDFLEGMFSAFEDAGLTVTPEYREYLTTLGCKLQDDKGDPIKTLFVHQSMLYVEWRTFADAVQKRVEEERRKLKGRNLGRKE